MFNTFFKVTAYSITEPLSYKFIWLRRFPKVHEEQTKMGGTGTAEHFRLPPREYNKRHDND